MTNYSEILDTLKDSESKSLIKNIKSSADSVRLRLRAEKALKIHITNLIGDTSSMEFEMPNIRNDKTMAVACNFFSHDIAEYIIAKNI